MAGKQNLLERDSTLNQFSGDTQDADCTTPWIANWKYVSLLEAQCCHWSAKGRLAIQVNRHAAPRPLALHSSRVRRISSSICHRYSSSAFAAGRGQPIFRCAESFLEALGATDVVRVFQLARVHAQISVRSLEQAFQVVKAPRRSLIGQCAENSQAGCVRECAGPIPANSAGICPFHEPALASLKPPYACPTLVSFYPPYLLAIHDPNITMQTSPKPAAMK